MLKDRLPQSDKEYKKHFLCPSGIYANASPSQVTTVLGTCVAVCLWDPKLKVGAINHFMLPLWNGQGLASPKFGNIAIERIIQKMMSFGSTKRNIKAKVFGGKSDPDGKMSMYRIGERNAEIALHMLGEEGIEVVAQNLGGPFARKLVYFTDTGDVYMSQIQLNH